MTIQTSFTSLSGRKLNIEIIMSLKNDAVDSHRRLDIASVTCTSICSFEDDNLIMTSIKDALVEMDEKSKRYKNNPIG